MWPNPQEALVGLRLWCNRFPLGLAKFLRTPFLQNTSGWLLLKPVLRYSQLLLFQGVNFQYYMQNYDSTKIRQNIMKSKVLIFLRFRIKKTHLLWFVPRIHCIKIDFATWSRSIFKGKLIDIVYIVLESIKKYIYIYCGCGYS